MPNEIVYCCPKDQDQVLFVEESQSRDVGTIKMLVPESPKTCPKCGKSYYKYECIPKER